MDVHPDLPFTPADIRLPRHAPRSRRLTNPGAIGGLFVAWPLPIALATIAVVTAGLSLRMERPRPPVATYEYIRSEVAWLVYSDHPYAYLQPKERELWIAPDGSGRLLEQFGQPDFLGPLARADLESTYEVPRSNRIDLAPGSLLPSMSFPASVKSFDDLVSQEGRETQASRPLSVLRIVRSLLKERIAPASVRRLLLGELLDEAEIQHSCTPDALTFATEAGTPLLRYSLTLDSMGFLQSEQLTLLEPSAAIDAVPPVLVGGARYLAIGSVGGLDSRTTTPFPADAWTFPTCSEGG